MRAPGFGDSCPCGSGTLYAACCGPLHRGRGLAATPEQLMRSRYAAYAVGELGYVFRTWHPRTRPADIDSSGLVWTGLSILSSSGDQPEATTGEVEFVASYVGPEGPGELRERSRFEMRGGRWVYVAGDVQ